MIVAVLCDYQSTKCTHSASYNQHYVNMDMQNIMTAQNLIAGNL